MCSLKQGLNINYTLLRVYFFCVPFLFMENKKKLSREKFIDIDTFLISFRVYGEMIEEHVEDLIFLMALNNHENLFLKSSKS